VRDRIRSVSKDAHTAAVANISEVFQAALEWENSDWVYFRYLPPPEQMAAVRNAQKRAFIAGATVSGNVPENWRHAVEVNLDAILTDYPFELAVILRKEQ